MMTGVAGSSLQGPRALALLLLWASASGLHLQAISRSDVLLGCEAPEDADLENLVLEWTRSDFQQNYVFMFRDGRPLRVFQHHRFKDRVELVDPTASRNLSIRLLDVNQLDSGRYQCHVYSQSHARKRSVLGTPPIQTIDLTVAQPVAQKIVVARGQDVVLPLEEVAFPVSGLMWKRHDDPERFVFLFGMGHPHHQHPGYSGRTHFRTPDRTPDQTQDLSVILRQAQPSDSGTYQCYIVQSQRRMKRDLHQSEPFKTVLLTVATSEALRVEAGLGLVAAVVVSRLLQSWA